jgi:hypothetical protein
MAKEMLSGAAVAPSMDIMSLGLVILQLATGLQLPEDGPDWISLREGRIPAWRDITSVHLLDSTEMQLFVRLEAAVKQMASQDPRQRPSAPVVLQHPHVMASRNPRDKFISSRMALCSEPLKRPVIAPISLKLDLELSASSEMGAMYADSCTPTDHILRLSWDD